MPTFDPVYLSINNRPRAVLATMDELRARYDQQKQATRKRRWLPAVMLLAGFPFCMLDVLLGYDGSLFIIVGIGCVLAAIAVAWVIRRRRIKNDLSPDYGTARAIINTLRDDLDPKRNFFGHLDLTGAEQPSKLFREGSNALGLAVAWYRDEWLNLKTKLYDGNMLRLSAVGRVKVRKGYYKRSRVSGKNKWKQPKYKQLQELKVRLSVNPNMYDIKADPGRYVGQRVGQYTITMLDLRGGIVQLQATTSSSQVVSDDILGVLHLIYTSMLQRKVTV
jgi:hypothetical protein